MVGTLRTLAEPIRWQPVLKLLAELGQNVLEPPSVKGWEGGRLWITSSSLLQRANFVTEFTTTDKYGPLAARIRSLASIETEAAIEKLERWLLAESPVESLHQELLKFFQQAEGTAEQKLRGLLQLILSLPEYQLF